MMKATSNCKPVELDELALEWNNINWNKIERYIFNIQKRIYRAEANNNKKKVRDLSRMLINSNAALLYSIKRVTKTNKGKRTAGLDNYIVMNDGERMNLFHTMKNHSIYNHKVKPVRRTYIPKKHGKKDRWVFLPLKIGFIKWYVNWPLNLSGRLNLNLQVMDFAHAGVLVMQLLEFIYLPVD